MYPGPPPQQNDPLQRILALYQERQRQLQQRPTMGYQPRFGGMPIAYGAPNQVPTLSKEQRAWYNPMRYFGGSTKTPYKPPAPAAQGPSLLQQIIKGGELIPADDPQQGTARPMQESSSPQEMPNLGLHKMNVAEAQKIGQRARDPSWLQKIASADYYPPQPYHPAFTHAYAPRVGIGGTYLPKLAEAKESEESEGSWPSEFKPQSTWLTPQQGGPVKSWPAEIPQPTYAPPPMQDLEKQKELIRQQISSFKETSKGAHYAKLSEPTSWWGKKKKK